MTMSKKQSVRVAVDLQACQTSGSANRGVGRYSHSLFCSLVDNRQGYDVRAIISSDLPCRVDMHGLPQNKVTVLPTLPAWGASRQFNGGDQDQLDSIALSALIAPLNSDVVHVSHVFEGFGDRVALPSPKQRVAGQILSATLYDLIPLIFRDHYFQNEGFRKWYFSRLDWLRQADLLLAISESSRQDAIDLLGIEPWRITTIHGGISPHFKPSTNPDAVRRDLTSRYHLRPRFILYTGGDDHRKNIAGAISGYAAIPGEIRSDCQLVIVCAMEEYRREMHLNIGRKLGLHETDILITGYVPEADLVAFYQTCDAFVFPSLYEGLGLPVLEAMACGAPVLGGNNSSIKELIVRSGALFDANSSHSIADALVRVLTDDNFAQDLRRYGADRAKEFTWARTSQLAEQAFNDALERTHHEGVQCAVSGWLPRKRLAMLSPLPPCRSGIADYNAEFLPYLSRHFEIDLYVENYTVTDYALTSAFKIFDARDFDAVAPAYDAILYEFGNSPFHAYMLPFLEKYPGIVGLHDAFLSGLIGYTDFHLGETGRYNREMLFSHGPNVRRVIAPSQAHPDPNGATDAMFPCTKNILNLAMGVISHSPFNLDVAEKYYPERWQAPYRIIPQMVPFQKEWASIERVNARRQLGFNEDDVIITTFGHVVWPKWGDRLLDAFVNSTLCNNPKIYLIFAGEISQDSFGHRLRDAIKKAELGDRIQVTGFLSKDDYERYLRITDIAVQLRTKSRGGTPRGVLDCFSRAIPVMVNNDASYTDYPDDVLIKLAANPSIKDIADALEKVCVSSELRTSFAQAGLRYVRANHEPAYCAAEYAAAIHEFIVRNKASQAINSASNFAPHLARCDTTSYAIEAAARWIENIPKPRFARPRLFIDVTEVAKTEYLSGIQRVVRNITYALYCSERSGFEPVAVKMENGSFQIANEWLSGQGLLCPHEILTNAVEFMPGDVLLMLDSTWLPYKEFFPIFAKARESRVPIYTVVYDLLPLRQTESFTGSATTLQWFEDWFHAAAKESDGLVCISKCVAEDVNNYISNELSMTQKPKIGFWHLGADFTSKGADVVSLKDLNALISRPYLLMVGTIEPRKSHDLALSAMEHLWAKGSELCLCIAGKAGWMVDELMSRLRHHRLLGRMLFLIENPTDSQIACLYQNASGLLFLSKGEGFGLPLVEAANYGIPIICSDIPVFHEIAGSYATYVPLSDTVSVANDIEGWYKMCRSGDLPNTKNMPRLSWEQSAEALLDVLLDNNWIKGKQ